MGYGNRGRFLISRNGCRPEVTRAERRITMKNPMKRISIDGGATYLDVNNKDEMDLILYNIDDVVNAMDPKVRAIFDQRDMTKETLVRCYLRSADEDLVINLGRICSHRRVIGRIESNISYAELTCDLDLLFLNLGSVVAYAQCRAIRKAEYDHFIEHIFSLLNNEVYVNRCKRTHKNDKLYKVKADILSYDDLSITGYRLNEQQCKNNVYRLFYEDCDFYYYIDVVADSKETALKYAEARAMENDLKRSNEVISNRGPLPMEVMPGSLWDFIPIINKTDKDDVI